MSDTRAVTYEDIEEQHARLHDIFNTIRDCTALPHEHGRLPALLSAVSDFLTVHFTDEERFMEKIGYPQVHGHKWQHEVLARRIHEIAHARSTPLSADDLLSLCEILIDHHKETDHELMQFYLQRHRP